MPKEYSRKSRVNVQLQRVLTELIRDGLTDPRVKNVTVTRVDASPDLRNARVFISVMGDDSRIAEAAKALNHAAGKLRRGIAAQLELRLVPTLSFGADVQLIQATRVNLAIREALRSDDDHARTRESGEEPAAT